MNKMGLEKSEEPEIKWLTFVGSKRKEENSRKTSTSASLTMLKTFTVWIITNCGKFLKTQKYQTTLERDESKGEGQESFRLPAFGIALWAWQLCKAPRVLSTVIRDTLNSTARGPSS